MKLINAISTTLAPQAIGPYSQAVQAGNFMFLSGQLPIDPATGVIREGTIEERASQVFKNISAIVESANLTMSHVVKVTIFLTDMADFPTVNQVYQKHFDKPFPARSAVQVAALPLSTDIEAEAIAFVS